MKVTIAHADTCLPDYWGGHHLPHVSVPVHKEMTFGELKKALKDEVLQDAIAGNYDVTEMDGWYDAARAAIDALVPSSNNKGDDATPFSHLDDPETEYDPTVYAFFVFVSVEGITH